MPNWNTDASGLRWLVPEWDAPARVRAVSTSRAGGVSLAPYDGLNLATHVNDQPEHVAENRARLRQALTLPAEPLWLEQVHGCEVVCLPDPKETVSTVTADAAWSDQPGQVCAVMTADCLPLLLCDRSGREVAAVHAGWRGLCDGVIEAALERFSAPPADLLAWLGPAIGPDAFEVGSEVRAAFLARDPAVETAFQATADGKWLADLFLLARRRLRLQGVTRISGGGLCTHTRSADFFSYRRDGITGRMATLVWIDDTGEVG
jgi:YfiH family protein